MGTNQLPGAETIALWLFDEPEWLYPSHTLDSNGGLDAPMVLGSGGTLAEGKWGRALTTIPHAPIEIPMEGEETASLQPLPIPKGRTQEPMTWHNAHFAALMTSGENHLRKQVSFVNPTRTALNLGAFDWTVEFWMRVEPDARAAGVVFEIGSGPRGENDAMTRLTYDPAADKFEFSNAAAPNRVALPAAGAHASRGDWRHFAFVHSSDASTVRLYVDGRRTASGTVAVKALTVGEEAYMSVGRNGTWGSPLPGRLDELRVSKGRVYDADFEPPGSFAPGVPKVALMRGPPLLFAKDALAAEPLGLGSRKHVFWDGAIFEPGHELAFSVHPPSRVERVFEDLPREFRKHLTVIEDENGLIRIYNGVSDDYLGVRVSRDGVDFEIPDTGLHHRDDRNIVIAESAPLGRPIIDRNGPPEHRWKYVSGLEGRGVYLYTSPDGWKWTRHATAVLPFRSGSQSSFFYDEQRRLYVGYHRTGFPLSQGGGTRREFVLSETSDIYNPWPVTPLSQAELFEIAKTRPLRAPQPWWLDNGPLTPGDFGVELPTVFAPDDENDPPGSGVYVPKATKYPWAEDAYIAFPAMYFDYEEPAQPAARRALFDPVRRLGSGMLEAQVAVSRDGVAWRRMPRPAYVSPGRFDGRDLHQIYLAEGMVRRDGEIWQYFYGQVDYHSPHERKLEGNGVYRAVQRLDGFVSADAPYEREITVTTRPFLFEGNRLVLNIDTHAMGYALVGFLGEDGRPIPGFSSEECVYVNGNFIEKEIEWLPAGADIGALAGKVVRVRFRLRGASLYAMQFMKL